MKTENTVSDGACLEMQNLGGVLYRNNSGVDRSASRPVRYGLGNDSPEINKVRKSSDLIGITPVLIQQHHVGRVLGVFTAVEAKKEGWTYRPSDSHAVAQGNFINQVVRLGGVGFFVNDTGLLVPHLKQTLQI